MTAGSATADGAQTAADSDANRHGLRRLGNTGANERARGDRDDRSCDSSGGEHPTSVGGDWRSRPGSGRADVWTCRTPTYCGADGRRRVDRRDDRAAADADPQPLRERRQPRLGIRVAQRRRAADLPRGCRTRRRPLRGPPWPGVGGGAHRGLRPVGAVAVPDGPHRRRARQPRGLEPRPVRGRADRRRGVGSRCDRHAQPDVVDGGRLPPFGALGIPAARRSHLLRRRRRGGGRGVGRGVDVRAPSRGDRRRLLRDRARRLVDRRRARAAPRDRQHRREGHGVAQAAASPARPATARCRTAPTTRW